MIIAIDGPAGAGKSTIAKLTAQKLGFFYIDTGAMYRAVTLKIIRGNIPISDLNTIVEIASISSIDLIPNPDGSLKVLLDGEDVSCEIREPAISRCVSDIAKIKGVRLAMVKLQRALGAKKDAVLDGRDIGTVVFPHAEKKFFLDANFKERVNRRHKELLGAGKAITWQEVEADLSNRDTIDSTREVAPLKQAEDAIYIDTTDMTIEQVVDQALRYIKY